MVSENLRNANSMQIPQHRYYVSSPVVQKRYILLLIFFLRRNERIQPEALFHTSEFYAHPLTSQRWLLSAKVALLHFWITFLNINFSKKLTIELISMLIHFERHSCIINFSTCYFTSIAFEGRLYWTGNELRQDSGIRLVNHPPDVIDVRTVEPVTRCNFTMFISVSLCSRFFNRYRYVSFIEIGLHNYRSTASHLRNTGQ